MNLKVLTLILLYFGVMSMLFLLSGGLFIDEGYTQQINLDDKDLIDSEIDTGGLFNSGVSFSRFVKFIGFGIGLPTDTPTSFKIVFSIWQTIVSIVSVGFVISSIWNG